MVEALGPNRPHDPFGYGVRFRRPWWGAQPGDTQAGQLALEVTAISGISIVDEVVRLPVPGRRLQELLPDPRRGGTGGDVDVKRLSPLVFDEEEDVEGPEGRGLDDEQICRPALASAIGIAGWNGCSPRCRASTTPHGCVRSP